MEVTNPFGWIEIPVHDMERAISFYNSVFGWTLEEQDMGEIKMAWFPSNHGGPGASGSLVYNSEWYAPSDKAGPLVYFSCSDVTDSLGKVNTAGGIIVHEKKLISEEVGYMGVAIDSEGNRIAFHSFA